MWDLHLIRTMLIILGIINTVLYVTAHYKQRNENCSLGLYTEHIDLKYICEALSSYKNPWWIQSREKWTLLASRFKFMYCKWPNWSPQEKIFFCMSKVQQRIPKSLCKSIIREFLVVWKWVLIRCWTCIRHALGFLCSIDFAFQSVEMENAFATSCLDSNSQQEHLAALHRGNVFGIEALPWVRTSNC